MYIFILLLIFICQDHLNSKTNFKISKIVKYAELNLKIKYKKSLICLWFAWFNKKITEDFIFLLNIFYSLLYYISVTNFI
jgi:hypothetical protein